jgi:hypothetical protein
MHEEMSPELMELVVCTYSVQEHIDDVRLENVAQRDPIQEAKEALQSSFDERLLLRLLQHLRAEPEDVRKLATHGVLQLFRFRYGHLFCRKVEDFFRQDPENDHVVFA